ncbi:MAG TPA: PH domain-containing protein [Verrucomicrobiae bacterium]|nr:PH domain-containing protein [Verrucomicrobiae bacterium]
MALINCPECGKEVSTAAVTCPSCGFPVAAQVAQAAQPAPDTLLAEVRPSWWKFFWYLCFCWLIVPLIVAWGRRKSVVLRIYPGRITLERGLLSKSYREFMARDIRSIEIDQGILARMVCIGDLTISTAATVDPDEEIEGIPDPKAVRDLILAQRQS